MRGLEKERDKGQRVIENPIETKGMMVREKEYGREPEKNRITLETSLYRLQGYYFHNQQHLLELVFEL